MYIVSGECDDLMCTDIYISSSTSISVALLHFWIRLYNRTPWAPRGVRMERMLKGGCEQICYELIAVQQVVQPNPKKHLISNNLRQRRQAVLEEGSQVFNDKTEQQ